MSLTAAAIRLMAEKGLSALDIAEIAESMGTANQRSANAERQARYRARQKASATQDNVTNNATSNATSNATDVIEAPLSLPPNDNNSNPPTHTPEHKPRARKADDFPCPVWCETDVWADLKRNRRTKKLTNTATAHRQFVSAIEAMADDNWPPGKLVEAIAAKGWGGAHDPREDRNPKNDNRRQFHGNSNRNAAELARQKLGIG